MALRSDGRWFAKPQAVIPLNPAMIAGVAAAFGETIAAMRHTCCAWAIMPDHVPPGDPQAPRAAEDMILNLQRASHHRLRADGLIDMVKPLCGGHGWKVLLDGPADIWRAIGYAERNPPVPQQWPFVTPYDDWPLQNPNSPYARRLRGR